MTDISFLKGIRNWMSDVGNAGKIVGWSETNPVNSIQEWLLQPRDSNIVPLKLHIYGNESMNLQAEITDNYVESNVAKQDHIALKPQVFTVSGEVGELSWFKNDSDNSITLAVAQKLQPVVAFLPPISKRAQAIQDKTLKILGVVDSIDNFATRVYNMFYSGTDENGNQTGYTEQQRSYNYLMLLWRDRTPIDIQTPWRKLKGYVIQNIEFTQPDRTRDKTQVKISFKEFRTVVSKTAAFDAQKYMQRAAAQKGSMQNIGTTTGITATGGMCKARQWRPSGISTGHYNDWKPAPGD